MSHRKMTLLADVIGISSILLSVIMSLLVILPLIIFAKTPEQKTTQPKEPVEEELPVFQLEASANSQYEYLGDFRITAYCSCHECCGRYADNRPTDENGKEIVYGAASVPLKEGVSVAADTSLLPFGTEIFIDGKKYVVQDKGGAIKGNRIDIYFEDHDAALQFGVQTKKVYIERAVKNEYKKSENQISVACNSGNN